MSLPSFKELHKKAEVIGFEGLNVAAFITDYIDRAKDERQKELKERKKTREKKFFKGIKKEKQTRKKYQNSVQNNLQIFKLAQSGLLKTLFLFFAMRTTLEYGLDLKE